MEAREFGEYLKQLRKNKKMTIRQLELYSEVSNAYISQIERGERGIPSPDILKKLSRPLGVEYEELMRVSGYIDKDDSGDREAADLLTEYLDAELTDEEIMEKMNFKVDNILLSEEEVHEFIAFVRAKRLINSSKKP